MLWSKQCYFFDVDKWLEEHGAEPIHLGSRQVRNSEWQHMVSHDVISMPDKWEYPWFAAWDLGFHAKALSTVDVDFAKQRTCRTCRLAFHVGNLLPVRPTMDAKGGRGRCPLRTLQRTSSFQQTARFQRTSALHGRDRVGPAVDHLLPLIEYWGTAGDDKYLLITEDSIMDTVNQHPEVDDQTRRTARHHWPVDK